MFKLFPRYSTKCNLIEPVKRGDQVVFYIKSKILKDNVMGDIPKRCLSMTKDLMQEFLYLYNCNKFLPYHYKLLYQ